jgi:hypothetical protein
MMFLTLPKTMDAAIFSVEKSHGQQPVFSWTTLRKFIVDAAEKAIDGGIYVPPLFLVTDKQQTTDNAITPQAITWSINANRMFGVEVALFDSLYSAANMIESNLHLITSTHGLSVNGDIEKHVARAIDIARYHVDDGADYVGLFDSFDYHLASTIVVMRFKMTIGDFFKGLFGLPEDQDLERYCKDVYARYAHDEKPYQVISRMSDGMNFPSVGILDEYRALVAIVYRECQSRGAIMTPSEFEYKLLNLNFDSPSSEIGLQKHVR